MYTASPPPPPFCLSPTQDLNAVRARTFSDLFTSIPDTGNVASITTIYCIHPEESNLVEYSSLTTPHLHPAHTNVDWSRNHKPQCPLLLFGTFLQSIHSPTSPDNYFTPFPPESSNPTPPPQALTSHKQQKQKRSPMCSPHRFCTYAVPLRVPMRGLSMLLSGPTPPLVHWVSPPLTQGHHSCSISFSLDCFSLSFQHALMSPICKTTLPLTLFPLSVIAPSFLLPFTAKLFERGVRHFVSTFFPPIPFLKPTSVYRNHSCHGQQWLPYCPIQWLFLYPAFTPPLSCIWHNHSLLKAPHVAQEHRVLSSHTMSQAVCSS